MVVESETISMTFLHTVTLKFSHLILWMDIWPILYILILGKILVDSVVQILQMLKHFIQYQKKSHELIPLLISLEQSLSFGKLSSLQWQNVFQNSNFLWKSWILSMATNNVSVYPKVIGLLHFWENVCQVPKYLIMFFSSVVLSGKNGIPWKVAT